MKRHTIQVALLLGTLFLAGLVGVLPLASPGVQAQQAPPRIYVSPSGSDATGTGSVTAPYATISHAVTVAPTGAVVVVEPGMYDEMVNISRTVTLESMSSNPSNTIINATGKVYGIFVLGADSNGTVVEGFTVELANNHGIFVQDSSGVTIEHNDVVSNGMHPDNCPESATHSSPPSGPCIEENKAVTLVGTSDSTVVGNNIIDNAMLGGVSINDDGHLNPGALSAGTPNPAIGNVVTGNTIMGNMGACSIVVSAYNQGEGVIDNTVSNNIVSNNIVGIVVAADLPHTSAINNTVAYNTVVDNLVEGGIILHSNTPGDVVSGNHIVGNTLSGNAIVPSSNKSVAILLIGAVNPVYNTTISGNIVRNEQFGIEVLNGTGTAITSDNSFDASVTIPVQGAVLSQLSLAALGGEMSTISQLQSSSASTVSSLNAQVSTLSAVSYAALGVAVVLGLAAIILSVRKRG